MRFDKIIIRNTTPSETKILLEKNGPLNRKKTLPNWKVSLNFCINELTF